LVAIDDQKSQQASPGGPIKRIAKFTDGVTRLLLMLFALLFPLFFYSTFSPAMEPNSFTSIRLDLSFNSNSPFYSSALFEVEEYPGQLRLWLSRTRPLLGSYGVADSSNGLQYMSLATCSADLWTVTPQGLRHLVAQLNTSANSIGNFQAGIQIMQRLTVTRAAAASSDTSTQHQTQQVLTNTWTVPHSAARGLMNEILASTNQSSNGTGSVILPRFYSPYVFNLPGEAVFFNQLTGQLNYDVEECTAKLLVEYDPILETQVRYWCMSCNSMFTSGNYPNASLNVYPEWDCITTGRGCAPFNFEQHPSNFTATPMYYVVTSQPVPSRLNFLPNIGIVAIYTTFVLALGRLLRSMFSNNASNVIQRDMANPRPVAQLIEYIAIAREGGDLRLEQSIYREIIDLLRCPEKLFKATGPHKRLYDDSYTPTVTITTA
jgi:hypothetical protein